VIRVVRPEADTLICRGPCPAPFARPVAVLEPIRLVEPPFAIGGISNAEEEPVRRETLLEVEIQFQPHAAAFPSVTVLRAYRHAMVGDVMRS